MVTSLHQEMPERQSIQYSRHVSSNGKRRPPRPEISVISPTASEEEAAAIAAALEQFLADTAPAPSVEGPRISPWQRAALYEGVLAKRGFVDPWGDEWPWGR